MQSIVSKGQVIIYHAEITSTVSMGPKKKALSCLVSEGLWELLRGLGFTLTPLPITQKKKKNQNASYYLSYI